MRLYMDQKNHRVHIYSYSSQGIARDFIEDKKYYLQWKEESLNLVTAVCWFIYDSLNSTFDADEFWACFPFIKKEIEYYERSAN